MTDPKLPVLPDGLPPLPEPPAGHRWAYRGIGWNSGGVMDMACLDPVRANEWKVTHGFAIGQKGYHYAEAVPLDGAPLAAGEVKQSSLSEPECPGENCPYCTGEACMSHGQYPCECDTADRHYRQQKSTPQPAPPREWDVLTNGDIAVFACNVEGATGELLEQGWHKIRVREVAAQVAGGETPRTDAFSNSMPRADKFHDGYVWRDFARTLERELAWTWEERKKDGEHANELVRRLSAARAEAEANGKLAHTAAIKEQQFRAAIREAMKCADLAGARSFLTAALKAGEGEKGMSDEPVKWEDRCWHGSGRDSCRKKPVFRLIGGHGCALCEAHAAGVKPEMLERIEEQPEPK